MRRIAAVTMVVAALWVGLPRVSHAEDPGSSRPLRGWTDIPAEVLSQFKAKDSGRYLVYMREQADLGPAVALADRDARRAAVVDALRSTADGSQVGLLHALERGRTIGAVDSYTPLWVVNVVAVRSNEITLRSIAARPDVAAIAPDRVHRIIRSTRADTAAAQATAAQWNIDRVGAPRAWELGVDGSGTVVANLDTGVDATHPSLAARYRGADGDNDFDWWDAVNHEAAPYDDNSHGTHTMGTITGGDGLGPDPDDIGVAPGARWIAAKAFSGGGSGIESWILEAAQFLTAPTRTDGTDPRPDLAPDVVNNSWGGGQCDTWFDGVLSTWRAMGIFPAFSVGNSGSSDGSANSPGDSPNAFAVGATDASDEIAYFSSRGPSCQGEIKPEVSAPGVDVRSSVPGGGFASYDGTSMAAPHVAGAVALMVEASAGTASVDQMEQVLSNTALDLGAPGPDNDFGAGRLRAFDAVDFVYSRGILAGRVTDVLGDPIEGATVTAEGAGVPNRRTTTLADGTYRLALRDGGYEVTTEAFGFFPSLTSVVIAQDVTTTLDTSLTLKPRVILSGTVTENPGGAALSGAVVELLATPVMPTTTDLGGAYQVEVPVGTYEVAVERDGCRSREQATVIVDTATTHDVALDRVVDASGLICDTAPYANVRGTTRLQLTGDDAVARVQLPFPFRFHARGASAAWVSTNGYVAFADPGEAAAGDFVNRPIPDQPAPNTAVYALWDDLSVRGSARGVYTATLGTAPDRRFIIEYRNFEVAQTGDLVSFSVVLGEDGTIETDYHSLEGEGDGRHATVGIEGPAGLSGIQYSLDDPVLADRTAIRYATSPHVGFVDGTVVDGTDGLPVEGATIAAGGRTALSGPDGKFRLAAYPGDQTVEVRAPGYDALDTTVVVAVGSVTALNAALESPRVIADVADVALSSTGEPTSASVNLTNVGSRPAEVVIAPHAPLRAGPVVDPLGDAARIDAIRAAGETGDDEVAMTLDFSDATDMSEVGGYLQLDTDQNASTGLPPEEFFGLPEQDIGFEFIVALFYIPYWGEVDLYDADFNYVGTYPAEVNGQSVTFGLPLSALEDDGNIDFAMNVGDYEPTDWVPDAGHGSTGDAGSWLSTTPETTTLAPGESVALQVTADPAGLRSGEHLGRLTVSSNDPRSPLSLPVRLDLVDLSPPESTFTTAPGAVVATSLGQRVSGITTDDAAGVAEVVVTYTSITGIGWEVSAKLSCDPTETFCSWLAPPPIVPGSYQITARATDHDGNAENPGPTIGALVL